MYRDHLLTYLFPKEVGGFRQWMFSKQTYYLGGRVTILGVTIEWMDYYDA